MFSQRKIGFGFPGFIATIVIIVKNKGYITFFLCGNKVENKGGKQGCAVKDGNDFVVVKTR